MHPDEAGKITKRWQHSIKTGTNFEMEIRFLNNKGEYNWHLSRVVAMKDSKGNIVKWIGAATEIQKQVEQRMELEKAVVKRTSELQHANKELVFESKEKEKRAAELVIANKKLVFESSEKAKREAELVIANQNLVFESSEKEKRAIELTSANKELESFTYISSHDLQEPLRKIQTFAGIILEKENHNLSDKGKYYFRLMQNAAERMQTLIQDLLAFSRFSTIDRKFETTDLIEIIEEVKNDFTEAIAEKHAVIIVEESCKVHIIPFQFRQLLLNLISNALKFSNPNIPPHITILSRNVEYAAINIAHLPPQKEYCHIRISDNGIGFDNEFSEKIFEVFQRLHGKEDYAGTGIGLAIVKKIVENHNGSITATSAVGHGATFDIYIPVHQKINE